MNRQTIRSTNFTVRSSDGTSIAVWVEGSGPPLVMFHGATSDHTTYGPLLKELRDRVTTYIVDRRGRGASEDAPSYSIEREFDDVAAVVDAVADRTGGPVALWGHSYGADCAMGGATRTTNIHHLVLYEPGLGYTYPAGSVEAIDAALAAGDREGALVALLVGLVEMTDEEVEAIRSSPEWLTRLGIVHTVPRELQAEAGWVYEPGQFDGITAPTLLLAGSDSPTEQHAATERAAAAIPGSRLHVLDGHAHIAHQTDPALVASIVRDFMVS